MNEQKTISDSKEAFYKEFPYVIPHVFRRVSDEILVELNLLSHQKDFTVNTLFSLGLTKAFEELTSGYKPEEHIKRLFNALCNCNDIEPAKVMLKASSAERTIKLITNENIKQFIDNNSIENKEIKELFINQNNVYNRLTIIGILEAVTQTLKGEDKKDSTQITEQVKEIAKISGYPIDRVEKDISVYKLSIEKLHQSLELIDMLNKKKS